MTSPFDTILVGKASGWRDALEQIARSRNDIFLVQGELQSPENAAQTLQQIAMSQAQCAIAAGTTTLLFPNFGGKKECIFSCGRKILSPLGLATERANLRWGQLPAAAGTSTPQEVESVWGSAVYIKRSFLDKVAGFDASFLDGNKVGVPNILIDDLCLQAKAAGHKVVCTQDVIARVDDSDVECPTQTSIAFNHWKNKWGWDPIVPNIYHLRHKWNGTVLGQSMIQDLFDTWDAEEPTVDLIMLTGNALNKLKACLESLAKTEYPRLRFHILLNGSGDPVRRYLLKLTTSGNFPFLVNILSSPVNVGVPAGINWLMSQCKAPVIARMDDDIEVPPNWLREMVGTLRRYPLAGAVLPGMVVPQTDGQKAIVSPMRLYPAMCSYEPSEKMPTFPFHSIYLTNFLGGATVVMRKKAADMAGPLDLRFSPTQNEDIDFGLALRAAGYDLVVNGHVTMVHHTSGMGQGSADYYAMCSAQRQIFSSKWGRVPAVLDLALDRDGRILES